MPHLWIRGIGPDRIRPVYRPLVKELAAICDCPEDYFMLECLATVAVAGDEPTASYPFVEVAWFDRGLEAQDRFARAVDRHLREELGLPELEVAFRVYRERDYYANGEALGASPSADEGKPAEEELEALRNANRKLAEDLGRTRKALASASGGMATKLRDALRE